jgi:O-antigen biosynthesis rhamnosyltransferase
VDVLSLSRGTVKDSIVFENHTAYRSRLTFEIASTGFSFSVIGKFAALARAADVIHYHFPWPLRIVIIGVRLACCPNFALDAERE